MVGTQKLLYILPDLAYTAELLPGRKEGEYTVQSFHQINGEFMADDNLLPENLKKLFEKIEPEEYTLILPDFLFADTIVSVPGTDDVAIADYLRSDLLPKIGVSTLTHETKTTILMQRKSESRVQFTALEKEIADTLASVLVNREVKILDIVPLSWTIKSLISLEPSVSVVQIGTKLYLAEHYVGVNQTSSAPLDAVENIVETVTTLKGADPNLQTLYLLTNALVEEKMRAALSKTLPVQQLTLPSDDNLQMPSYVKQLIEAAGTTLNDKNYPVPHFALGSATLVTTVLDGKEEAVVEEVIEEPQLEKEATEAKAEETEAKPLEEEKNVGGETVAAATAGAAALAVGLEEAKVAGAAAGTEVEKPVEEVAEKIEEKVAEPIVEKAEKVVMPVVEEEKPVIKETEIKEKVEEEIPAAAEVEEKSVEKKESVLDKVAAAGATESVLDKKESESDNAEKLTKKDVSPKKKGRTVADFFKKLLLFILIFALTIAVGLGVGYGVLKLTGGKTDPEPVATPIPEPVVIEEPVINVGTDSAEASDSAAEVVEIDKTEVKIMVVNATGVAGLAGKVKTSLDDDGFTSVTTGNAKGEYTEKTDLVLMPTKNSSLISALELATGLTLTFDEDYQTEDANGTYDAVIVLGSSE